MINKEIIEWLLEEDNLPVRYRTLTELLDIPVTEKEVIECAGKLPECNEVRGIFSHMHPDGYWLQENKRTGEISGDDVIYGAFLTTHFCLAYLSEFAMDKKDPRIVKAADRYLGLQQPDGDFRRHFSCLYAYNIRTFLRLGFKDDPRVQKTIKLLLASKREDGGYLCDIHEGKYKNKSVKSCIRGSVKALLAFSELPEYLDHPRCKELVDYFLKRDAIFSTKNLSKIACRDLAKTNFPITWHAGLVEVLYALSKMGYGQNRELDRAWQLLDEKKDKKGRYIMDWTHGQVRKLFNCGKRGEANKWVTFYALMSFKYRDKTSVRV